MSSDRIRIQCDISSYTPFNFRKQYIKIFSFFANNILKYFPFQDPVYETGGKVRKIFF